MTDPPEAQGAGAARRCGTGAAASRTIRILAGVGVLLFVAGLGRFTFAMAKKHSGLIYGDSFTYVTSARSLSHGRLFYMDGPVAEMFVAAERSADRRYWEPIWNHVVRPDGRSVCSMAIGYPLLLAAALKVGGIGLLHHVNLLLVAGFLLVLAGLVWEGLGRDRFAGLTALVVALGMPRVVPEAIQQFTYPWREPYFYILVLGAAWALLRFQRSGRGIWLGAMALLSGVACSVKEVNVLYVFWLGAMVLSLPGYRRHPRVVRLTLVCAALFFAGLLPLLVQNVAATGNPFVSSQFLRETSQYSLSAPGAGLSMGNAGTTFSRYVRMYSDNPFYAPWALALALLGAVLGLRHLLGRTLLGIAAIHFVLYTQWGNADLRQSYFFNVPYLFFLVYGPFAVGEWLSRRANGRGRPWLHAGQVAVLAVLVVAPYPQVWRPPANRDSVLLYADARRLVAAIDSQIPREALLLSNRSVRDVLGAFSDRSFIRLSELYNLRPDRDVHPLLAPLAQAGRLYFLDNVDRDPHYLYRANRTRIDQETLLDRYRLEPVAAWDRDAYRLGDMVDQPRLTLYRVAPWEGASGRRELAVPPEGAAFLFANRRSAWTNLALELDGRAVPVPEGGGYYCPVSDWTLGTNATVAWRSRDGSPVPPLDDLAFVGWNQSVTIDLGLDAVPRDPPYFPDGQDDMTHHAPWRLVPGEFRLRLPVFAQPGTFWACTLIPVSIKERIEIAGPSGEKRETLPRADRVWFSVSEGDLGAEQQPVSTNALFGFRLQSNTSLRVTAVQLFPCSRSLVFDPLPESRGFYWSGRIVYDQTDANARPWSMLREGVVVETGLAQPWAERNQMENFGEFPRDPAPVRLDFQGAGVVEAEQGQVGEELELRLDRSTANLIVHGTYHGMERDENKEAFCWTTDLLRVGVPLTPGAKGYRLRLDAQDGHPHAPRELEILFGEASTRLLLEPGRREYDCILPASGKDWGMATLAFRIPTWQPSAVLGSGDSRDLGFRFYGLDWRPVKDEHE